MASPEVVATDFFAALHRGSVEGARAHAHARLIWFGRTMTEADWRGARFAEILARKPPRWLLSRPFEKRLLLALPSLRAARVVGDLGGLAAGASLLACEIEIAEDLFTVMVALEPTPSTWCVRAVSDSALLKAAFSETLASETTFLPPPPATTGSAHGPLARFALAKAHEPQAHAPQASRRRRRDRRNA
ncbi:MAG: hypothetical protein IT384_00010 [Deltaproteobacteria bacterium]|nr:hypothetical protein [Deltaproteobacteria bacterium]